jgi:hypothetical protein
MTFPITSLQSLPANQYLELLSDSDIRVSFSQMGEDIIVWHLLNHYLNTNDSKFYVDVGAFHPKRYSNTRFLSLQGWTGINIDANSESIAEFNKYRSHDINICVGVGLETGESSYYKFNNGWNAANTLSEEFSNKVQKMSGEHVAEKLTITIKPLNTILSESLPSNKIIDFMDIDVEGMDRVVAQSLDLMRFRPKVLSIELHDIDIYNLSQDATIQYFLKNNYKLMAINLHSYIFIDLSVANI